MDTKELKLELMRIRSLLALIAYMQSEGRRDVDWKIVKKLAGKLIKE